MSSKQNILRELQRAEMFFSNTQYSHIVQEASRFFQRGETRRCEGQLGRLPSDKELLARLMEKLKGKSVYKTMERVGKKKSDLLTLKGLSSLLTHTVIECEQGHLEYRRLIPMLLEKINNIGFGI